MVWQMIFKLKYIDKISKCFVQRNSVSLQNCFFYFTIDHCFCLFVMNGDAGYRLETQERVMVALAVVVRALQ